MKGRKMKNPITNTKQSKSAASGRPVNALSQKNSGTLSKSRKSALKKRVASYGAFNCILPALTILLISMGMIQGRKFLLMQESNQLINTGQSKEHAGFSGTPANALTIDGYGNQTILNDSKEDYSIHYCGETERFLSTNKANNLRFVYDAHSFTASGIEPEDAYIKEQSDLNDEKVDWSISISAAGISKYGEVPKSAVSLQNSKAKFTMSSAGNRAVAESEDLRIEYSNTEKGMRQDFIVKNKPAGNRDLMLKLDVNTELNFSVSKDAVKFTDALGIAKMNYSSLKVWDAEGKELQAYFAENSSTSKEVSGNPASGFSIIVKDQNAVYPVTIDPLSASPNTILTGSYSFGSAANPAGDVNGDGYDDVIVGAKETTTNMPNDGKVSLFYGSASGVSTTPAWTKTGDTSSTAFGHSVAPAGDVNGDGYDDFLIGNPGFKVNGVSRGRALLFLGSASGPDTTASWTFIGYGISDIGRCVYGAGDVNNDGYDDILVSTAYATFSGSQTGAVYMFYGSSSGPDTAADWEVRGANPFQNFGNSICTAGDINNDGYDDVIIGAPNYSSSTGAVYAYYGSASGLPASPNWTKTGSASGGSFGFIVYKAGDVNGDNYDDVIVGEPNSSSPGKAHVFHGSASGLLSTVAWTATGTSSSFGRSAATAGDYNGDGFGDVVVGYSDSSKVFVYKGSSAGLSAGSVWSYTGDGSVTVLGFNVGSAGDVNGDGYSDVMAAGYSPKVYVFHGSLDTGNVVVAGAVARNGEYETLADAFSAINSNSQSGADITVTIKGNTSEPPSGAMLNANSWNSLTVFPSGARTVSGVTNYNTPLVTLNGADNVLIDGLNTAGNSLTLSNNSTVIYYQGITLCLMNDASNNTVTRCSILGSGITGQYYEPSVLFLGQGSVTGNDNNVISHCNISGAGGNLPTYAVRSSGLTSGEAMFNSGDTVRDCKIYNFFNAERNSAGVSVSQGSTNFIIKNNRFYQTSARTATLTSAVNKGVEIANTSGNGFLISGNTIGYSDSAGTGNYDLTVTGASALMPIDVSAGTTTPSEVTGNLIRSIIVTGTNLFGTSSFTAIRVTEGNVNVTGNTVGDSTLTSSITLSGWAGTVSSAYGINLTGSGSCTTNGNSISGISYNRTNFAPLNFICISSSLGGSWLCQNNIIGSGLSNSISNNSTNVNTVTSGINSAGGTAVISGNIIRNINTSGGTIYGSYPNPFTGISARASGSQTISNNIIHTLTNSNTDVVGNGGASNLQGIFIDNSTGNIVEGNFIHSLKINSNIGSISGLQMNGGSSELRNNMIRNGVDAAGNGVNNPCYIYGIYDLGGSNDLYFNSVYIGGNPVSGNNASTYGIYSSGGNARNYFNNILFNARSNNGSSGLHMAIRINNISGFTSNYNILYANGTGGITGYYNAQRATIENWRTGTGQDANSKSANPNYINPAGNSSSVDLHISKSLPTPVESNGTSIGSVTADFDGQTRSSFSPTDIGADAGNFAQSDTAAMSISYSAITPASNNISVPFNGVTITDANGVSVAPGTAPRVYYKKKSDANELNDNTSSTAGWKYSEANNTSSPFNFTILFSRLNSPVTQTDSIMYFVVAQDLASTAHVGVNNASFSEYPFSAALTSSAFPVSGSINVFTFQNFSVAVSGAVAGNGMYTNLSTAFTAVNSGAQTGSNILIQISGNTTEPSLGGTLNENDWSTLTIVPSGGSARTVSGAVNGGLPLINLNGADRVRIDGLNTGGNSLTLINTTFSFTAGTSTINFKSDASDNVVTNCTILSSAAVHQSFDGGAVNFSTGTTTGNNNNVISYCNISKHTAGPLTKAVAFLGSSLTSAYNKGDTIRNCNIYDYGYGPVQSGVAVLSGNTGIVINDNRFYQTSTVSLNPDAQHSAVRIESSLGNGFTVSGNIIGYSSQSGTGKYTITGSNTARFHAILLQAGSTANSNISGNAIAEITMSGTFSGTATSASFIGIHISSGAANVTGNTIGSQSSVQSISVTSSSTSNTEVVGIHCAAGTTTNISGNNSGGLYGVAASSGGVNLFGIKNTTTNNWICQNNIFGGGIANSMQTTSTATSTIVIGIQNTGRSSLITGNTVRNFTAGGGTPGTYISSTIGILLNTSSATHTVSNNLIHNLTNTNTTQSNNLSGIAFNVGSTGNVIESNFIHSISSSSLNATITGLLINTGTTTYRNNFVSLGTGMNTGCNVAGILEFGGVNNFYFNSIYISGNPSSGSTSSFALRSLVNSVSRNYISNILFNSRSNSGATAKHYSISLAGSAPLPVGCYSNNNLLYSSGSGGVLGLYNNADRTSLAAWLSATGLDTSSVTGDPKFISSTDLHIDSTQASPVSNAGRYVAGAVTDFDGDTRNVSTPDIGADEFNSPDFSIGLTLSVFFEGFYNSGTNEQIADTVRVYLRNSAFPYAVVDSAVSVSDSAGDAELEFSNAPTGNYFISVRHRNTIETWSSSAIALTAGNTAVYSFSTTASQAYGSNMVQIDNSPVRFALYSGDANQDKTVDATDLSLIDNDAASYNSGYLPTDINGDGFADGTDFAMADNNASNFISAIEP